MKYEFFQVDDFVTEPFFQQWVRSPDEFTDAFWKQWIADHPEKEEVIEQARLIVQALEIEEVRYDEPGFESVKQNIKSQIFAQAGHASSEENKLLLPQRKWLWFHLAAAVSGLLLISAVVFWFWMPRPQVYTTGNGEQKEVVLPDGSEVLLNANTSLKIAAEWEKEREVWLDGEAYFEVEKKQKADTQDKYCRFIVHAQEIDVEVLGTSFNVLDRRDMTLVVLQEGVVALKKKQTEEISLKMEPGDLVSYSNQDQSFRREKANPRIDLSWKNGKHIYEATPLYLIARKIEDDYGLEVKIESEELGKRRFSASVSYGELDLLLELIAESMQLEILKTEDYISISAKP